MSNEIYDKKIIIIDIDFIEVEQYNRDNILHLKRILAELSSNQNLVMLTNNHISIASKIINELNLKSGHLISEGGGGIINISTKNTIEESELDKELCLKLCYKCIGLNLCFVLNSSYTKYPYKVSQWIIEKYKLNSTSHFYEVVKNSLNNAKELKDCINKENIRQMEIYFLNSEDEERKKEMERFTEIGKHEKGINFVSDYSCLRVNSNTKSNAVKSLATLMNGDLKEDALYIGINQFEAELASIVKFCLVTNELGRGEDKNIPDYIESVDWGETNWINGLKDNDHIGKGDGRESLVKKVKLTPNIIKNKKIIEDIQEGRLNYLTSIGGRNAGKEDKERINFGREQSDSVLEILNKK